MAKRPSLGHQFYMILESKKKIGQSRHKAKELGIAHEGIYSYKTYDAYKNSSKQFAKWIKNEFPQVKNLSEINKDMCIKYIQYREQQGCSAYTYSQDMAMISKLLEIPLTKKECNVSNRKLSNIKKNRIDNGVRTASGAIEFILKGTGLRRNELENLKVKDLLISNNKVVGVLVRNGAKGGKFRRVQVLKDFQSPIYEIVKNHSSKFDNVITEKIPKNLQAHRYRAEYAQCLYDELRESDRKNPLKDLTESMGHNRICVLVHYGIKIDNKQ